MILALWHWHQYSTFGALDWPGQSHTQKHCYPVHATLNNQLVIIRVSVFAAPHRASERKVLMLDQNMVWRILRLLLNHPFSLASLDWEKFERKLVTTQKHVFCSLFCTGDICQVYWWVCFPVLKVTMLSSDLHLMVYRKGPASVPRSVVNGCSTTPKCKCPASIKPDIHICLTNTCPHTLLSAQWAFRSSWLCQEWCVTLASPSWVPRIFDTSWVFGFLNSLYVWNLEDYYSMKLLHIKLCSLEKKKCEAFPRNVLLRPEDLRWRTSSCLLKTLRYSALLEYIPVGQQNDRCI